MKHPFPLLLSLCLLGGLPAASAFSNVELNCTAEGGTTLLIQQGGASAASATLTTPQDKTRLEGTYRVLSSSVFAVVDEYDLKDSAGNAALIQVSHHVAIGRGGCGRAGCPPVNGPGSHPSLSASLEFGGKTLDLDCEQTQGD